MQTVNIGDIIKWNGIKAIVTSITEYRHFGVVDKYGMRYLIDNNGNFKILGKSEGWLKVLEELE